MLLRAGTEGGWVHSLLTPDLSRWARGEWAAVARMSAAAMPAQPSMRCACLQQLHGPGNLQ